LRVAPASGSYGASVNLTGTLTAGGVAVPGRTITFTLNGANAGSALTGLDGVARLSNVSLGGISAGTYVSGVGATFADDGAYFGSSGANRLTVVKAGQAITLTGAPASAVYGTTFTLA